MSYANYKPAQPLALKELNQKYAFNNNNNNNKINTNNNQYQHQKKKSRKFNIKFKASAKELALDFGRKSTIHGMSRISGENINKYERFFWLLTIVAALLGSIYVCLILSQRFNAGTIQTVVERTDKPVFEIPFPEVALCNQNHLNWKRLEEAKQIFIPYENNTQMIQLFEEVIGLYDNLEFGEFDGYKKLEGKPLDLVNHINFSAVYDFMTWRCEELLMDCQWRNQKVNCCNIFEKSRGLNGLCWHFNTLSTAEGKQKQQRDPKYPWRTSSAGPKSGLIVSVMINEDKHFRRNNDKAILVGIMEPGVFHRDPYSVPADTMTVAEIDPVLYYYENNTRILTTSKRECMFSDERTGNEFEHLSGISYMIENCVSYCHQGYLLKYCNCTVELLFPPSKYPVCKVKDMLCLAKYNDFFWFTYQNGEEQYIKTEFPGMRCNCFRNCHSLNYVADLRSAFLPVHLRINKSYVDLDIFYRFPTLMVYRTSLVFGWVDLMVAFGGIFGLFLGFSLIGAIELLYFSMFELPLFVFKEMKIKPKAGSKRIERSEGINFKQMALNAGVAQKRQIVAQNLQNNNLYLSKYNLNKSYI